MPTVVGLGRLKSASADRLSNELDKQHRLVIASGRHRVGQQRLSLYRFRHNLFQKYLYSSLDEMTLSLGRLLVLPDR